MTRPEAAAAAPRAARIRPGAKIAAVLLALLVSGAVYAPFLANDEPLYLSAIDRGAYQAALATLPRIAASWREKLVAVAVARAAASDPDASERIVELHAAREDLRREFRALEVRLATVRRYSPDESATRTPLDGLEHAARGWTQSAFETRGDDLELSRRVVEGTQELARTHASLALRARASSPLCASLSWVEWWAALAWSAVLVQLARRASLRAHAATALGTLALAALAAAGATAPAGLTSAPTKEALDAGEVEAERVLFAPIAFGPTEIRTSETFRPPTWLASSEIDDEGRYVRGPRAPVPDPATGFVPAARPVEVRRGEPARNSALRHPLGTDSLGRDVLVRLLWGGRVSLLVGAASVVLAVLIGVCAGAAAGYFRGAADALVSAAIAVLESFPAFFLIVVAVALLSARGVQPELAIVAVIALHAWIGIARLVRAECLRTSALDYVLAARALGFSHARILARHVVPNSVAPVYVAAAFWVTASIAFEAATSFLGFGVRPPTPSWGAVMHESQSSAHWWILVFPGSVVFAACLACNWIGDALRDRFDPREAA